MKSGRKKYVLDDEGTVLDKARERYDTVWEDYTQMWVSFSGGKDSGSVLSMAMDAWERNGPFLDENGEEATINVIHFDDEFHYPETLNYIERVLEEYGDRIKFWWCAIPIKYGFAASSLDRYDNKYWYPWHPDKQEEWFRPHPSTLDMTDRDNVEVVTPEHELVDEWGGKRKHGHIATNMIAQKADDNTIQLLGVRTSESLNRHTALIQSGHWIRSARSNWESTPFDDEFFGGEGRNDFDTGQPIYDWHDRDLWAIHEEQGWDYNRAYDKFHQLGWSPGNMRTGMPWGYMAIQSGDPQSSKYHWAEEYDDWISRHTGMETAFCWGADGIGPRLPEDKTWEEYTALLINNIEDEEERQQVVEKVEDRCERHYENKREPLPDRGRCEICSQSWRMMAHDVYENVYGLRTGQA